MSRTLTNTQICVGHLKVASSDLRTTYCGNSLILQQRDWIEVRSRPQEARYRLESLEQRFEYITRYEKILSRPQAGKVLAILRLYGSSCLPMRRKYSLVRASP